LGWLNQWLGVVVGFALPRSAWGGGFALGLGLCGGGFGSLPRPRVVDSVGLGLCRGLGWLNRWLGVVVGSPEVVGCCLFGCEKLI
jgi:hypothetical protein